MSRVLRAGGRRREGFSLVIVVLLVLAGMLVAHGLILLAQFEYAASAVGRDVLAARLAARAGVVDILSDTVPRRRLETLAGSLADSVVGAAGHVRYVGTMRRLGTEVWLAEGHASAGPARVATRRAVWALDASARVDALPAVLVTGPGGGVWPVGAVRAEGTYLEPTPSPAAGCGPYATDSIPSDPPRTPPREWAVDSLGDAAALGLLTPPHLGRLLLDTVAGLGSPAPDDAFSTCRTGSAWNWGDPLRPRRPCSDYMVAVTAPDRLVVQGGVGQGLLLLEGGGALRDLTFFGVVIATGPLDLLGATTVTGVVLASELVTVGDDASIRGSACWAWAALLAPPLRSPLLLPGSGWIRGDPR